jgi:hypothetical protein
LEEVELVALIKERGFMHLELIIDEELDVDLYADLLSALEITHFKIRTEGWNDIITEDDELGFNADLLLPVIESVPNLTHLCIRDKEWNGVDVCMEGLYLNFSVGLFEKIQGLDVGPDIFEKIKGKYHKKDVRVWDE